MPEKYATMVNEIIDDLLAQAPDHEEGIVFLKAMIFAGTYRLAREAGRIATYDFLEGLQAVAQASEPGEHWPP